MTEFATDRNKHKALAAAGLGVALLASACATSKPAASGSSPSERTIPVYNVSRMCAPVGTWYHYFSPSPDSIASRLGQGVTAYEVNKGRSGEARCSVGLTEAELGNPKQRGITVLNVGPLCLATELKPSNGLPPEPGVTYNDVTAVCPALPLP